MSSLDNTMNYKYKKIECEDGKQIEIFDNVFPLHWRTTTYTFVKGSYFQIGWEDDLSGDHGKYDQHIHSKYSHDDFKTLGMREYLSKVPEINDVITKLRLDTIVVNLSCSTDSYLVHTHPSKKVILYYTNLEWQDGYHGETQFWSEDRSSVQFTSPYVPGRVIMFDSTIPHCLRPQSTIATKFRFTLATQYT